MYDQFCTISIFSGISPGELKEGYLDIAYYAFHYFNIISTDPVKLWGKIHELGKEKESWKPALIFIKLCLCSPFSNATPERFFSHVNFVRSDIRSRLSNQSLNSILRICMKNLLLTEFSKIHMNTCVDFWYRSKNCRINQRKQKGYKKCDSCKKKRVSFHVLDISSESSSSNEDDERSSEEED